MRCFILKVFCLVLSVFIRRAVSRFSCRQCSGDVTVHFDGYVQPKDADDHFSKNFVPCQTGNAYQIKLTVRSDCQQDCLESRKGVCIQKGNPQLCQTAKYSVHVWRYCFNGGSVTVDKHQDCTYGEYSGPCHYQVNFVCTHSVKCKGSCLGC